MELETYHIHRGEEWKHRVEYNIQDYFYLQFILEISEVDLEKKQNKTNKNLCHAIYVFNAIQTAQHMLAYLL